MKKRVFLYVVFLMLVNSLPAYAQIIAVPKEKFYADSIRKDFDNGPYFTLYKDNYFTTGTALGHKPTGDNSDVKFQVSVSQRLTKSVMPFHSYLFLAYSQKCMWNVYKNSMPMRDLNFNPGIGLSRLLIVKDRLIGKLTFLIEHESNGRDSINSRSWNRISLCANIFLDPNFMIHGKYWIPIVDGENNRDILKYTGIYQTGIAMTTSDHRMGFAVTLMKRKGWNMNWNTIIELNYRIFKNENQYFFLQYYNGYGENLLDYNRFHSRIRIGLIIKPKFFSEY
jgi:phospholipase A1